MENTEILVNLQTAETIFIRHPEASYGIFCFNSIGDLFLNSDYGFYGYAWRAYGEDFKKFLAQCNSDYIVTKFEINYRNTIGKPIPKRNKIHVQKLIEAFIKHLKSN